MSNDFKFWLILVAAISYACCKVLSVSLNCRQVNWHCTWYDTLMQIATVTTDWCLPAYRHNLFSVTGKCTPKVGALPPRGLLDSQCAHWFGSKEFRRNVGGFNSVRIFPKELVTFLGLETIVTTMVYFLYNFKENFQLSPAHWYFLCFYDNYAMHLIL